MNQRWLWNFPEGPCSPCFSPSDCQSLTSTAAAIGWRANRVEHYWSAVLCHTDHSVQAPLFLLKSIFAAMQRFPPVLDALYSFGLACPFWLWQSKSEGIWKRPFGRLYSWLWCTTQWFSITNSAVLFIAYVASKRGQDDLFTHIVDISNHHCRIYITGSEKVIITVQLKRFTFDSGVTESWLSRRPGGNTDCNTTISVEETCHVSGHKGTKTFFVSPT